MIKPNTLCFIVNIPPTEPGYKHVGKIVEVLEHTRIGGKGCYKFTPALPVAHLMVEYCRPQFLKPLQDFDPDELLEDAETLEKV